MSEILPFRISTHLKDVIGRDLVTNEFVAVFELVKNSFDAGATKVHIEINPDNDRLTIVDDGKGMSASDIKKKWLFVAYSAKADGTEDDETEDYRDKIRASGNYAGSKGIGRFSCDTLGTNLKLFSKSDKGKKKTSQLTVDWEKFENDSQTEFEEIKVDLDPDSELPHVETVAPLSGSGTVLEISGLRHRWDFERVQRLRSYLAKLIDPFGTTESAVVSSTLVGFTGDEGNVNGPIKNDIADVLKDKTARISVSITDDEIVSTLVDRGRLIYKISEPSTYTALAGSEVSGETYYLNRSAKQTFSTRMKVRPVEFGSIFLFLNGFRVFPIGEEFDDTFGLNRRKQQGQSRRLGTRDVLGRVDVSAPLRMFREASSRDAGLIEDAHSRELIDAILKQMILRLERYVVGVNWPDKADQERETDEGLHSDPAKLRILQIIGGLARSQDIEILKYDENIVELADAREDASRKALKDLMIIAEREGDEHLLKRIEETKSRIAELERSEQEAQQEAKRLAEERARSDARISQLVRQTEFLAASQDLDAERIQLLLHQVNIYSGHIHSGTDRALNTARNSLEMLNEVDDMEPDDLLDLAGSFRHDIRQLMDDISYIRLENDRLQSVSRFAPNIRVDLDTNEIKGDLIAFLTEYFDVMIGDENNFPKPSFDGGGLEFQCTFSPFDLAVVVDNLIDNARKARAQNISFSTRKAKSEKRIEMLVVDDGVGLDSRRLDPTRIFEKHYSATVGGTGLGLYHVSQVLNDMGGKIELDNTSEAGRADFVITISEK
ncbi:ATP-binding protein [Phaeobacter inhibens]|uniref:ATP-binding protein n=1 Tax=Phaeobacter inhibens TaxID=221822 RepID=UPI0021A3C160|nr:ATP-binding protein [Phaeobacter inhibens]UWR42081.1 ATP-binding protein [Phaeobacter inhibens]